LNGQISASGGDDLAVYLGETISVTSIATAPGWLSEHNIKGYASDTSSFSISEGAATLPALPNTTTSGRTVTWTPANSGTHTLYVEAFTGTSPGHQLHGVSGWPGYAGGPLGGYEDKRVTIDVLMPDRNAYLQWWGEYIGGQRLSVDNAQSGGGGDKIFMSGNTITLRGYSYDTDGMFDVEWIRLEVINPFGQTVSIWTSNSGDDLDAPMSVMERDFSFPSGVSGSYTVQVTTQMSRGTATISHTFSVVDLTQDTDGDGIPDWWEHTYELDMNNPDDALDDADGDGFTNVAEYNLGTHPGSANDGSSTLGDSLPAGWSEVTQAGSSPYTVGSVAGELSITQDGSANYVVPISVVPGTAGMAPTLSLKYSSNAGAGLAGYGWSLAGVSAITRGPQTNRADGKIQGTSFTDDDRFYLDGQRLVAISGNDGESGGDGQDGTEYRTEIDTFSRIVSYGRAGNGPAWFKVWTKAGLIIEYGRTNSSAFKPQNRAEALSWAVSRISDTAGNYMLFVYELNSDSTQQTLQEIQYTGNINSPVVAPYASVKFTYENRTDSYFGYVSGSKIVSQKKLKSIVSYYGSQKVRSYTLNYDQRQYNNRSILSSLTESAHKDQDTYSFAPLLFEYSNPPMGFASNESLKPPTMLSGANGDTPWPSQGVAFVDLDGDGHVDCVQKHGKINDMLHNEAWLNTYVRGDENTGGNAWSAVTDYRLQGFNFLSYDLSSGDQDTGVRFADFNGDGLIDTMNMFGEVYLNTGNTFVYSDRFSLPEEPPMTFGDDFVSFRREKSILTDLNGDGRVDYSATSVVWLAWGIGGSVGGYGFTEGWINHGGGEEGSRGSAWTFSQESAIPFDMASIWPLLQCLDLNNDGLIDAVKSYSGNGNYNNAYIKTHDGWRNAPEYALPEVLVLWSSVDGPPCNQSAQFVDLNGDGLPDLIGRNDGSGYSRNFVYMNTGGGWVQGPGSYLLPVALYNKDESCRYTFLDINSDGLPDLVGPGGTWMNTGTGWTPGPRNTVLENNLYQPKEANAGFAFIDANNDGAIDFVWNYKPKSSSYSVAGALINKRVNPDRLTKVTNSMGVSAKISYEPINSRNLSNPPYVKGTGAAHPRYDLVAPIYVVHTVSHDDGVGDFYDLRYAYGNLRSEVDYGSLGFEWMRVTDTRTEIEVTTYYSQNYPAIGLPTGAITRRSDNGIISEIANLYTVVTSQGGRVQYAYLSASCEKNYELDGTQISEVMTITVCDEHGNATIVAVDTSDSTNTYIKTTTNTYENWISNTPQQEALSGWMLGRLVGSTVTAVASGVPSQTRTSDFEYDENTGLLSKEIIEPGESSTSSLKLTTTYEHNRFGLKEYAKTTGAGLGDGREVFFVYDSLGRFVEESINEEGHSETTAYDAALGVPLSLTGPNGLTTSWEYDAFGRTTEEHRADDTVITTRYAWAGNNAPMGSLYFMETTMTGAIPGLIFYDYMGREVSKYTVNGGGIDGTARIVTTETEYDLMGRAYKKSLPHYKENTQPGWIENISYDVLNRPLEMTAPDDTTVDGKVHTSISYSGLSVITTNPLGQVEIVERNFQGQVIKQTNNAESGVNSEKGEITYAYDAFGNMLSSSVRREGAGDPVTTTFKYDNRGRKIEMIDPDMGDWTYSYNAAGELVSQTDAKSQTTLMGYDKLGRLTEKEDADAVITWAYDSAAGMGVGKLHSVSLASKRSSVENYTETHTYDSLGRSIGVQRVIEGTTYTIQQAYDNLSRPTVLTYPGGFSIRNEYNALGFLKEVRANGGHTSFTGEVLSNHLFWQADAYAERGEITESTLGNGLTNDHIINTVTGRISAIVSGRGAQCQTLNHQYQFDALGQVTRRVDDVTGRDESFTYDGLNRLVEYSLSTAGNPADTTSVQYNALGNVTYKSDVGSYDYGSARPHAVTSVGGGPLGSKNFSYDNNGNMLSGAGRDYEWSAGNHVRKIVYDSKYTSFILGSANERVVQKNSDGTTTTYIGSVFEKIINPDGLVELKHYIFTPQGRTAVRTVRQGSEPKVETRYFHHDALGSVMAVSDEWGRMEKRFAYDPWGNQATLTDIRTISGGDVTRGFTDHEMLGDFGLIHMNGRVYDPIVIRFLSADPIIGDSDDSQAYNRYSYVENNPLNRIDSSGYLSRRQLFGFSLFGPGYLISPKIFNKYGGQAAGIAVAVVVTAYTEDPALGGMAGGFVSGFTSNYLNGASFEDSVYAGGVAAGFGAVTAAASSSIGGIFGAYGQSGIWGEIGRASAQGVVGGTMAEAQGGNFWPAFYASAFSSLAAPTTTAIGDSNWYYGLVTSAAVGGTASKIGGEKFANGAYSAAFQYLATNLPNKERLRGARTGGRSLTELEINEARKVFGEKINYSRVRIYDRAIFFFQPSDMGMTPFGNIYIPNAPADFIRYVSSDPTDDYPAWLMHELTHVYQYQNGTNVAIRGFVLQIAYYASFGLYNPYKIDSVLDKPFSRYNIEQQGVIVEKIYNNKITNIIK
jgi:RHS repeat-associated protein